MMSIWSQPAWGFVAVMAIGAVVLLGQAWIARAVRRERGRRPLPPNPPLPCTSQTARSGAGRGGNNGTAARWVVEAHYAHQARERRRDRLAVGGYDPEMHGYHEGRRWRR